MNEEHIIDTVNNFYAGYNGWELSEQSINKLSYFYRGMKYDEASTTSFLKALAITQPRVDDIFLDIGSGLGKKVIAAALLENTAQCIGIEFLEGLYEASNSIREKMQQQIHIRTDIKFIYGDYYNVDFSYASIVHISISPRIIPYQLNGMLGKKLKQLKKGTRVIISEIEIPFNEFFMVNHIDYAFPSRMETAYIYEKIR